MFNAGDKVLVYSASNDKRPTVKEVARVTKTMAILENGSRYSLSDGIGLPRTIGCGHIEALTEGRLAAIRRAECLRKRRSAIGAYVAAMKPDGIEWLYGVLRERGMPEVE